MNNPKRSLMNNPTPDVTTLQAHISNLLNLGFRLTPLNGKVPMLPNWQNVDVAPEYFMSGVACNIGVVLDKSNLVDVDLDCAESVLIGAEYLPPTYSFRRSDAPKPTHYLYICTEKEDQKKTTRYNDPTQSGEGSTIIEYRLTGQTSIPPSIHPRTRTQLLYGPNPLAPQLAPSNLSEIAQMIASGAILAKHWPSSGHEARLCLAGFLFQAGWEAEKALKFLRCVQMASNAKFQKPDLNLSDVQAAISSTWNKEKDSKMSADLTHHMPDQVVDVVKKWLKIKIEKKIKFGKELPEGILLNEKTGGIRKVFSNTKLLIEHFYKPYYDTFKKGVYFQNREIEDEDYTSIREGLSRDFFYEIGKYDIIDICRQVAREHQVDSLQSYLVNLPKYEQPQSIIDYVVDQNILPAVNKPFAKIFLRRWLISGVARGISSRPVKVDNALALVGEQGTGKSTFFESLVPDASMFTESDTSFEHKDTLLKMHGGVWIVELAELASLRKDSQEKVKSFFTSVEDKFRKPYGIESKTCTRRFIFGATTNESDFLRDPTGNRRFWPVEIDGPINVAWIRQHRDLIWAEARDAYLQGEKWYLDQQEEKALRNYQEEDGFRAISTLESKIRQFVENKDFVSVREIREWLNEDETLHQQEKKDLSIANALRSINWKATRMPKRYVFRDLNNNPNMTCPGVVQAKVWMPKK